MTPHTPAVNAAGELLPEQPKSGHSASGDLTGSYAGAAPDRPWVAEHAMIGSVKDGKPVICEWFVRRAGDNLAIAADIIDPDTEEPSEAFARLIAATPELLEACLAMLHWDEAEKTAKPYDDDDGAGFFQRIDMCNAAFSKARAAIAKATGAAALATQGVQL